MVAFSGSASAVDVENWETNFSFSAAAHQSVSTEMPPGSLTAPTMAQPGDPAMLQPGDLAVLAKIQPGALVAQAKGQLGDLVVPTFAAPGNLMAPADYCQQRLPEAVSSYSFPPAAPSPSHQSAATERDNHSGSAVMTGPGEKADKMNYACADDKDGGNELPSPTDSRVNNVTGTLIIRPWFSEFVFSKSYFLDV